jgi:hypothetical protein
MEPAVSTLAWAGLPLHGAAGICHRVPTEQSR